jgi:Methyltransferase domain
MTAVHTDVMQRLYRSDIWTGFNPTRSAGEVQGWNGHHPVLERLAKSAAIVVDVGVWKGQSTITLANGMKSAGINGCVIAVDTFLGSTEHWHETLFERRHGQPDLYQTFLSNVWHAGLSEYVIPVAQTSFNAAKILARSGIRANVIHVDAAHEYEEVIRDITDYWAILAPGGVLICDDYHESWPGVVKAAGEFSCKTGMPLAVDGPKCFIKKPAA